MRFLMSWLINMLLLLLAGALLYALFPDIAKLMWEFAWGLFGPWIIIGTLLVAALPAARRR